MDYHDEFTAYLQSRDLAPRTIQYYHQEVNRFFRHLGKEAAQVSKKEILEHLQHLQQQGRYRTSRRNRLLALHHYFTALCRAGLRAQNPCGQLKIRGTRPQTLSRLFTAEELDALCDHYDHQYITHYDDSHLPQNQRHPGALRHARNAAILSVAVYQGLTTRELIELQPPDLDLRKATVHVKAYRQRNAARTLPLAAPQIGTLWHYTQTVRPQLIAGHRAAADRLFLTVPNSPRHPAPAGGLAYVFKSLTPQLRRLEPAFTGFHQLRASRITLWLQACGLRRTQYLAGHRYITSTEKYLAGDLEALAQDITRLHPF